MLIATTRSDDVQDGVLAILRVHRASQPRPANGSMMLSMMYRLVLNRLVTHHALMLHKWFKTTAVVGILSGSITSIASKMRTVLHTSVVKTGAVKGISLADHMASAVLSPAKCCRRMSFCLHTIDAFATVRHAI